MRIVIILLVLPILAYGLTMGYLWYEVKNKADQMVEAAAAFATVSYDGIHLSPLGDEVGLNNITIRPTMNADEFAIDQFRLSAPHIGYFISAEQSVEKGRLPENLGMQFKGVRLDLRSELFTMMEQMQQQQAAMSQASGPAMPLSGLEALGCGERDSFSLSDYRRMGIGEVVANMAMEMRYDESRNTTMVSIDTGADNLYQMQMSAELDTAPGGMSTPQASLQLNRATINYRDRGYNRLRNDYCAKENGSDVASYVERHTRLLGNSLGASFSAESLAAYKEYLIDGGSISATLTPANELQPASLQYYKPAEIIDMLGLKLRINNKPVNLQQVQWQGTGASPVADNKTPAAKADSPKTLDRPHPQVSAVTPAPKQPERQPQFRTVSLDEAERYLQKKVEVTIGAGKVRRGILERVNEGRLYLAMHLHGGTLSYPVKRSDITRLRVKE